MSGRAPVPTPHALLRLWQWLPHKVGTFAASPGSNLRVRTRESLQGQTEQPLATDPGEAELCLKLQRKAVMGTLEWKTRAGKQFRPRLWCASPVCDSKSVSPLYIEVWIGLFGTWLYANTYFYWDWRQHICRIIILGCVWSVPPFSLQWFSLVLLEASLNELLQLALQSLQAGGWAGPPLLFDSTSTVLSERLLQALSPQISQHLFSFKLVSVSKTMCIWSMPKSTKETSRPLSLLTQLWALCPSSQSSFKKPLKKLITTVTLSAAWDPTLEGANAESLNIKVAPYLLESDAQVRLLNPGCTKALDASDILWVETGVTTVTPGAGAVGLCVAVGVTLTWVFQLLAVNNPVI